MEEDPDITLYLDELKSDDNSLKINALSKLNLIASKLSITRIEDELFPYLRFILEETDNEDEYLVKMCQNVFEVLKNNAEISKDKAVIIFEPLAIMEDPGIRGAAIEGLNLIAREYQQLITDMVLRFYGYDLIYARIAALQLILKILKDDRQKLNDEVVLICDKIAITLFHDQMIPVKRFAIRVIVTLWKHQNCRKKLLNVFKQNLLNEFKTQYFEQTNESMLFELLENECLIQYLNLITEKESIAIKEQLQVTLESEKSSWRIKCLILENYYIFTADSLNFLKYKILFDKLFSIDEQEVKCSTVRALTALLQSINNIEDLSIWHESFEDFIETKLRQNPNYYVNINVVDLLIIMMSKKHIYQKLHDISMEMFLEMIDRVESDDFKAKAVKYLEGYLIDKFEHEQAISPQDEEIATLFAKINAVSGNKNWKLRFNILEKIENILNKIQTDKRLNHNKDLLYELLKTNMGFREDLALLVRKKIISNMRLFHKIIPSSSFLDNIEEVFDFWIYHKNHIFRVTVLQSIVELKDILPSDFIENWLNNRMEKLRKETIINVKINILKMFIGLTDVLKSKKSKEYKDFALNLFERETDPDIEFFREKLSEMR